MPRWTTALVLLGACAAWAPPSVARGASRDAWMGLRRRPRPTLRLEPLALRRRPETRVFLAPPRSWDATNLWSFAPLPRDGRARPRGLWRPPLGTIFDAIVRPRADAIVALADVAPLPAVADSVLYSQLTLSLPW